MNDTETIYSSGQQLMTTHEYFARVVKTFEALLEEDTSAGMEFVYRRKQFPAHKAMVRVASYSQVCEALFLAAMNEDLATNNRITISDAGPTAYEIFLDHLFTENSTNPDIIVEDLIFLAHQYEVRKLKSICEDNMRATISEGNVIRFLIIADWLSCSELRTTAYKMILTNRTIFEKKFRELNSETLQTLKRALQNAKEISDSH